MSTRIAHVSAPHHKLDACPGRRSASHGDGAFEVCLRGRLGVVAKVMRRAASGVPRMGGPAPRRPQLFRFNQLEADVRLFSRNAMTDKNVLLLAWFHNPVVASRPTGPCRPGAVAGSRNHRGSLRDRCSTCGHECSWIEAYRHLCPTSTSCRLAHSSVNSQNRSPCRAR